MPETTSDKPEEVRDKKDEKEVNVQKSRKELEDFERQLLQEEIKKLGHRDGRSFETLMTEKTLLEKNFRTPLDCLKQFSEIKETERPRSRLRLGEFVEGFGELAEMFRTIDPMPANSVKEWIKKIILETKDNLKVGLRMERITQLAKLITAGALSHPLLNYTHRELYDIEARYSQMRLAELRQYVKRVEEIGKPFAKLSEKDHFFYEKILQNDNYVKFLKENNCLEQLLWKVIRLIKPNLYTSISGAEEVLTFLTDPSLPKVVSILQTQPFCSVEIALAAGRNLHWKGKEATPENIRDAIQEVNLLREKFGDIKIFSNRPIVLFSNNEILDGAYRFARKEIRESLMSASKKDKDGNFDFQSLIAPPSSKDKEYYDDKLKSANVPKEYFSGTQEEYKNKLKQTILSSKQGTTFIIDAHGMPNEISFDGGPFNKGELSLTAKELALIIKEKYKTAQHQPPPKGQYDVFVFSPCHSSEFMRSMEAELKGSKCFAVFIAAAEYAFKSVGFPVHDERAKQSTALFAEHLPTLLYESKYSNITIGDLFTGQEEVQKKGSVINNFGIFLHDEGEIMQIGKNEQVKTKKVEIPA